MMMITQADTVWVCRMSSQIILEDQALAKIYLVEMHPKRACPPMVVVHGSLLADTLYIYIFVFFLSYWFVFFLIIWLPFVLLHSGNARPMAWFFLAHVSVPNLSTVMFYYQTEFLNLEASFLGTVRVVGWLGLMLGTFTYNHYLKKMRLRRILM